MRIESAKDLEVYQLAYGQAMRVYDLSKLFPAEERYAMTSQIRRSSRSVCLNLREAWAKRRYPAHFLSKLTDCDGENAETSTALDFCLDCGFISAADHSDLSVLNRAIGRKLGAMMKDPRPFVPTESMDP